MIFATVGSSKTPFDRLVKAVDNVAKQLTEEVTIQIGVSKFLPQAAKYFDFGDSKKMNSFFEIANIVISHGGFGIITECIRLKKRLIIFPREHRFGDAEGIQVELAEYLANTTQGIICVRDASQLLDAVTQIKKITPQYNFTNNISWLIQNFINGNLG